MLYVKNNNRIVVLCICSAQSRNRYHSRMALRKVRIPTWLRNSRMVSDHSRIAQGIFSVYRLGRCPAQSKNDSDQVRVCQNCTCAKLRWSGENARMLIYMLIYMLYLFYKREGKAKVFQSRRYTLN